jgi:Mlc titration factor MtfA (ptsG expression regulator)
MKSWLNKLSRQRIIRYEFPEEWMEILNRNVPFYGLLPAEFQKELQQLIMVFAEEKVFEGCGGLELTDEIIVTVAAQACILLLGQNHDLYPALRTILIYPTAYFAPEVRHLRDGSILETVQFRFGESWSRGQVVLAWDEIKQDTLDINDGHNLIFHEFAHQLDYEYGIADKIPEMVRRSRFMTWGRILSDEYEKLLIDSINNKETLLNKYGAISHSEFFAVATEFYFEKPVELKNLHPALYAQLNDFYKLDTAKLVQENE